MTSMAGIHMCNHHVHPVAAGRACIALVYNTLPCRSFTSSIRPNSVRRAQHLREQTLTTGPASRRRSEVKACVDLVAILKEGIASDTANVLFQDCGKQMLDAPIALLCRLESQQHRARMTDS